MPTRHNSEVLALDGDVVIISHWDQQRPAGGFSEAGYLPPADGPGTSGMCRIHRAAALARTADGFAALTCDKEKNARWLHLLSGDGRDFEQYEHHVIDLWTELPGKVARRARAIATDPGSGRIALAGDGLHLGEITGDGVRFVAAAPLRVGPVPVVSLSGPDRLVTVDDGKVLRVWRHDEHALHVVAERRISGSSAVDLPAAGVVAVIVWPDNTRRWVRYLDGETLADVPTPSRFDRPGDPYHLFTSPDGGSLGVGYFDFVELTDVTGFADRPLADTTPADLHAVRARLAREPANPFLDLLHTCLTRRFEMDVALGSAAPLQARGDDIALGGSS